MLLWIWVHTLFYCFLPPAPPLRYKTNYSLEEWVTTQVGWEVDWSWPLGILALHLLPTSKNHCSGRESMEFLHTPVSLVQPYRCPTLYITNSAGTSSESISDLKSCLFLCVYIHGMCIYHQWSFSLKIPTWLFYPLSSEFTLAGTWIWLHLHYFNLLSWILFI